MDYSWYCSSSVDSLKFIPQRKLQVTGIVWGKETHDKEVKLKFRWFVGDTQPENLEWFDLETKTNADLDTIDQCKEEYKFYRFDILNTGCDKMIFEEGETFTIQALNQDTS